MDWIQRLLDPDIVVFLIPITAIVTGGVIAVVHMIIAHRERIAMIERGMDPRRSPEQSQSQDETFPVR